MENPSGGSVPARVNPTPRCAGLKDEFKVVANAADFERKKKTDPTEISLGNEGWRRFSIGPGIFQ